MTKTNIVITDEPINPISAIKYVTCDEHGGISTFFGVVRNFNVGKQVIGVEYDIADKLAQNIIKDICDEARKQWGEQIKTHVEHFKGYCPVGATSVAVATSSAHRSEAFASCRYIIEQLKHQAPIWKKEYYIDGKSEWMKGHALCQHA